MLKVKHCCWFLAMELDSWLILLFTFYILNILSHTFGFCLLFKIYRDGKRTPQEIFLMNLGLSAIIRSILLILLHGSPSNSSLNTFIGTPADICVIYAGIVMTVGVYFLYILTLLYILYDKFLQIHHHMVYPIYINENKAKTLILCTWLLLAIVCTVCMILLKRETTDLQNIILSYVYLSTDACVIIHASVIYYYIFRKYKKAKKPPVTIYGLSQMKTQSTFVVFLKSSFVMSFFLIISFILFSTVPDVISTVYRFPKGIHNKDKKNLMTVICFISYVASDILDSWVYIFAHAPVRQILCKWRYALYLEAKQRSNTTVPTTIVRNDDVTRF